MSAESTELPSSQPPPPRQRQRDTRQEDRVSMGEKLALGSGYLPVFLGNAAINSIALPFYQMTLHMNPSLLGAVLAAPRIWDAVTDPVTGYISDNLQTRWGRRRPLIFIGAIMQALAFGAIWMAPADWSDMAKAVYLLAMLILFYTCYTIFSVPLMGLTYEMTPDYKERTRVTAFAGLFNKVGEIGYAFLFPLAGLAIFGGVVQGVRIVGWGTGLIFFGLVGILPALFVKERYYTRLSKTQAKVKFWSSFKDSMRNRAFVVLIGLTVCQVLAGMLASSTDYYLIVYYMFDGDIVEGSKWKGFLSVGYAIVGVLSIYPVNLLANHWGKRLTLSIIFGLVFFGALGKWFLYTPGNPWKILFDPILCGPIWTALNVLMPSMLADVCDDDELRHGQRREGMFGSIFSWIQKTGFSLSVLGMGIALDVAGFDAALGGAQSPDAIHTLRLFLAVSTAVWAAVVIAMLSFYPLSQQRVYEIRDALEARRGSV
ncbi:MAG: Na+/melibiose symporter-like protein [Puniceicoccaceae bacterium 5H]|nr:MAG: Na+/melibiose symporter-like protein [Puniceicoccaceae bacterium 5H]